jgi:hypothetical protein
LKVTIFTAFWFLALHTLGQNNNATEPDIPQAVVKRNFIKEKASLQLGIATSYIVPMAGLSSYIKGKKYQPFGLNFQYNLPSNYGFGVELSHNYLQEKRERATYYYDGSIILSNQTRTLAFQPLIFFANKYFANVDKEVRPMASLGLGFMRVNYLNYWGIFEDPKKKITPVFQAGLGFKLNLDESKYWVLDTKIKYTLAPFKYDFIKGINYLGIDVNLGIRWWHNQPD